MTLDRSTLHRTLKLELDEGRAASIEEALELSQGHVLQLVLGRDVCASRTREAMALTAINAASRAFIGGVRVLVCQDGPCATAWGEGMSLSQAAARYGATLVEEIDAQFPLLVIGDAELDHPAIWCSWDGWRGAVTPERAQRLPERREHPLAGALAGALGVSEAFQSLRGYLPAGRREIGLSLWRPGSDWRSAEDEPERFYLARNLWLLGLGHLGQAYAWTAALAPYPRDQRPRLLLQDFDVVDDANESTSMLLDSGQRGERKTRAAAARLEQIGIATTICERAFDEHVRRADGEPAIALAGFDKPEPRRHLEGSGYELVVDAGLGAGPRDYLEMLLHSFPNGSLTANETFARARREQAPQLAEAYEVEISRRAQSGEQSEGEARCGMLEVAGATVAAVFVGMTAACLVHAEVCRAFNGGPSYEVIDFSLRAPEHIEAVEAAKPRELRMAAAVLADL